MARLFFLLFILSFIITRADAQRTLDCKCNRSLYSIEKYLSEADSISKVLYKKKYRNIIVVGARGLSAANLMFIGELDGKNKAFRYDLINKKTLIFEGPKLDRWKKNIVGDASFLYTAPLNAGAVDHEVGFYISFNYPKIELKEVCESQIIGVPDRPFAVALWSYLNDFH
jgi:hypothetical protein